MKKLSLFYLVLIVWCVTLSINLKAQQTERTYDYPTQPGTPQWKNFKTTAAMLEACQIPTAVLQNLSTDELLKVCLKYPLLNDYIFSNSPSDGFKNVIKVFNGLRAFLDRSDSHLSLLKYYKSKDVNEIKNSGKYDFFAYRFGAVELLISQDEILNRFSRNQKVEVLNVILNKYDAKANYTENFGFMGKMTTAYVGNKYAEALGKKPDASVKSEMFTKRMLMTDLNVVDETILSLINFSKVVNKN